jgi:hypothetical protein
MIALALAASLTVAACGGDSGPTGSRGDTASVSASGAPGPSGSGGSSSSTTPAGDGCRFVTAEFVSGLVEATVTAKPIPAGPPFNAPSCLRLRAQERRDRVHHGGARRYE